MSLPSQIIRQSTEFFGTYDLVLDDPGVLKTDNTGLTSCTAIISFPAHLHGTYLSNVSLLLGASHPIFGSSFSLLMESREVAFKGPRAIAKCAYAGIDNTYSDGGTPPQYELIINTSESPIATHPEFDTDIGGTPTAPLNGANFRHVDGSFPPARAGAVASSNLGYVFDSFDQTDENGNLLELAGVSAFLEAGATWRKSWKMNRLPTTTDVGRIGMIEFPEGNPPTPSGRSWLNMGINVTHQRGGAYFWDKEWRLSGRNGWTTKIYRISGA